ncbi:hypothetical protein D3C71_376790 [compost metagenome]
MLCAGIMNSEPGFKHISPIKPDGGADGKRDIFCELQDIPCVGAVSFVKSANDDSKQRSKILNKIKSDMAGARRNFPDRQAFASFTNVVLTPTSVDELKLFARNSGFVEFEYYDRNRIAQVLCSPRGMHLRYQFLKLKMSDEEQIAFFNNWGREIGSTITEHMHGTEDKLSRLLFLQEMKLPITEVHLRVTTADGYTFGNPYDGTFICSFMSNVGLLSLIISTARGIARCQTIGLGKMKNVNLPISVVGGAGAFIAYIGAEPRGISGVTLEDIQNYKIFFAHSKDMEDKITNIYLSLNGYALATIENPIFSSVNSEMITQGKGYKSQAGEDYKKFVENVSHGVFCSRAESTNFNRRTPKKNLNVDVDRQSMRSRIIQAAILSKKLRTTSSAQSPSQADGDT